MADATNATESALAQVRDYYQRTAEEVRREQDALDALHRLLVELAEQSLRLHQQSAAVLAAINQDLDKVKAQLKRMSVARS
jgi:molybdopterin converting factor small subunit